MRVRKALNMAINKKAIIDGVYLTTGVAAKNPIPPTMWSYNDAIKDDPYDPEAAKKLLAQAGYPDGFTTDLWAMPVQRPYNPNAKRIAELMQADLAKIGVKAEIKSFEWGEYRKRMQAGEHQMGMLGWTGDNGDPDNFLYTLLGCASAQSNGSNVAKFCYKPYEDLVVKAKNVPKQAEREALYKKAQVIFKEQAPWFTIAHAVQLKPVRKEVVDFKLSPFGRHTFYGVDIKQHESDDRHRCGDARGVGCAARADARRAAHSSRGPRLLGRPSAGATRGRGAVAHRQGRGGHDGDGAAGALRRAAIVFTGVAGGLAPGVRGRRRGRRPPSCCSTTSTPRRSFRSTRCRLTGHARFAADTAISDALAAVAADVLRDPVALLGQKVVEDFGLDRAEGASRPAGERRPLRVDRRRKRRAAPRTARCAGGRDGGRRGGAGVPRLRRALRRGAHHFRSRRRRGAWRFHALRLGGREPLQPGADRRRGWRRCRRRREAAPT